MQNEAVVWWQRSLAGGVYGIAHTMFIWSLLKIPPACALSLYVLPLTLAELFVCVRNRKPILPATITISFFLACIVAIAAPMEFTSLYMALLALTLNVLRRSYLPIEHSLSYSIAAFFTAGTLHAVFATTLFFGKTYLAIIPRILTFAGAVIGVIASLGGRKIEVELGTLILSAFIPTVGERVGWWDLILLGLVVGLSRWTGGEDTKDTDAGTSYLHTLFISADNSASLRSVADGCSRDPR